MKAYGRQTKQFWKGDKRECFWHLKHSLPSNAKKDCNKAVIFTLFDLLVSFLGVGASDIVGKVPTLEPVLCSCAQFVIVFSSFFELVVPTSSTSQ